MKWSLFLAAASLVAAAPLRKRDTVYEVVAAPSAASAGSGASAAVPSSNVKVVYVDQNGNVLSGGGSSASAASPTSAAVSASTPHGGSSSGSGAGSSSPAASSAAAAPAASSAAAAPAASSSTSAPSGDFQDSMLSETNNKRSLHAAGALTWNPTLASYAANAAAGCVMQHTGGPYGENIYMTSASSASAVDAVDAWYNEVSQYNYNAPGFSEATGHFTQLVWKATTEVGCASQTCSSGTYVFCEYQAAGNVVGNNNAYFTQNVS